MTMTALRRGNCIIEMKIAVIMRNKFLDFDNQPFNTVPFNAGSDFIGILENPTRF